LAPWKEKNRISAETATSEINLEVLWFFMIYVLFDNIYDTTVGNVLFKNGEMMWGGETGGRNGGSDVVWEYGRPQWGK
jgi:hypothetical protein